MPKVLELTGHVFGRLTAIEATSERSGGRVKWLCRCVCGCEAKVSSDNLKSGRTQSCGCLKKEVARKIGSYRILELPVSPRKLAELYRSGQSSASLAREFGVASATVKRSLIAAGITPRSHRESEIVVHQTHKYKYRQSLQKAQNKRTELMQAGVLTNACVTTAAVRRRAVQTLLKTNAGRRAKEQADREQSEVIERALNGETFR